MSNRRSASREELLSDIRVYVANPRKLIGYILDISDEGIQVVSDMDFTPNEVYEFAIESPEQAQDPSFINIRVKTVWNDNETHPLICSTGFKYIDRQGESINRIKHLIEEFRL